MAKRTKSGTEPLPGQPISLRTLGEYLNLSPATISLVLGAVWMIAGIAYGAVRTRGFRSELVTFEVPSDVA